MERLLDAILTVAALAVAALLVGTVVLFWSYIDDPSRYDRPRVVVNQCTQEGNR